MNEQKILAVLKELQKNVEELLRLNRLMHSVENVRSKEQQVTEITAVSVLLDPEKQRLPENSSKEGKAITSRETSRGVHR